MENSSFDFFIDLPVNCIFVKHYSVFDLERSSARVKAIVSDPSYRKGLNRIIDCTGCSLDWETDDIRKASDQIAAQAASRGAYREAFLVDSLFAHGMFRILDGLAPSPTIEYEIIDIFDTGKETAREKVFNWLQINSNHSIPDFINLV
ncbi:MAG: hypothetical protein V7750_17650 [Sneathiella sp.]